MATKLKTPRGSKKLLVQPKAREALYSRFFDDADAADAAMKQSGRGFAMEAVHAHFAERFDGKAARPPRPIHWRKSSRSRQ